MAKYTDLPIALTSKDNDIVCVVDPDADVSNQMTLAVLRAELAVTNYLGGSVAPLVLPVHGAPIQMLNTFSQSGGVGLDPVAGTMNIPEDGTFSINASLLGLSDFATNTEGNWNNRLWMRVDDGVGGIVDHKIGTFSTWVKNNLVEWTISTHFLVQLLGTPTTTISFGVDIFSPDEDAITYTIDGSSFFVEQL